MKRFTLIGLLLTTLLVLIPFQSVNAEKLKAVNATSNVTEVYNGNDVMKVIDGDTGTQWYTGRGQNVDDYVIVEFDKIYTVGYMVLTFPDGNDRPAAGKVEISTDNATWIKVKDFVAADIVSNKLICNVEGGQSAKYVKMTITEQKSNWLQFAEIEVYSFASFRVSTTLPAVGTPEYLYTLRNDNNCYAKQNTYKGDSDIRYASAFAFYASDTPNAYYIYSYKEGKWLKYNVNDANDSHHDFVEFCDNKTDAKKFLFNAYNGGEYYDIQPYAADGSIRSTYLNWFQGTGDKTLGLYTSNAGSDKGSKFYVENFSPLMSTLENKVYYNILNCRQKKYVGYKYSNTVGLTQMEDLTPGAYWYFVEATDADPTQIPAGSIACRIYNVGNSACLENAGNGNFNESGAWDKIWIIRPHKNGNWNAFAIHQLGAEGSAFNDYGGSTICHHSYDDAGSIFNFIPVTQNAANTHLNACKAICNSYNYSYYYTVGDAAFATLSDQINSLGNNSISGTVESINQTEVLYRALTKNTAAPVAGDIIQFRNRSCDQWLRANGTDFAYTTSNYDLTTYWVLEQGENGLKIKNFVTGKYFGDIVQSTKAVLGDDPKEFVFSNYDYCFAVFREHDAGNEAYVHYTSDKGIVGWYTNAKATQWMINKVQVPTNGQHYIIKSALSAFSTTKAVYATEDNPRWGTLDRTNRAYYWTAENVVVDGVVTGIALKNASTGEYMQDTQNAGNSEVWTMGTDDTARALKYESLTYYNESANEFSLTNRHDMHARGHGNGSGNGDNVISYDQGTHANSASSWLFEPVADIDAAIAAAKQQELKTLLDNIYSGYYDSWGTGWRIAPGVNNYSQPEGAENFVDAYNTARTFEASNDIAAIQAQIDKMNALKDELVINQPEIGKYYALRCTGDGQRRLSSTVTEDRFETTINDKTHAETIFLCEANGDDKKALLAYATGLYADTHAPAAIGTKVDVAFLPSPNVGQYLITVNGRYIYGKEGHKNNHVDSGGSAPGATVGYSWWLEPVVMLPVNISAARYATFYAPVAVTVPEGIKAYYLTTEGVKDGFVSMTEAGNVIPQGEGVILELQEGYEPGVYQFNITDDAAALEGNIFEGTVAATLFEGSETNDAYILAMPEGATVPGLYKTKYEYNATGSVVETGATHYKNNGHKAYLPVSALTPEQATTVGYRFGGEEIEGSTAIEEVEAAADSVIYDLAGRRVERITERGVYIVNGKAVLVK